MIVRLDKGKPVERQGRKAMGLKLRNQHRSPSRRKSECFLSRQQRKSHSSFTAASNVSIRADLAKAQIRFFFIEGWFGG